MDRGGIVDWVLGALPSKRARRIEREIDEDPGAAREVAQVRALVDAMRTLTVQPSDAVSLALHHAVTRRTRARQRSAVRSWLRWAGAVIAGATLVWTGVMWSRGPSRTPRSVAAAEASTDRGSDPLALLREDHGQRSSPRARRTAIARSGGDPALVDRIDGLAASLAATVTAQIGADATSVDDAALALRALLASGSGPDTGHRRAVAAADAFLERRIAALEGPELATALAALVDFAVVAGDRERGLVAEHATRLASAILAPPANAPHSVASAATELEGEQGLLHFETKAACLADAGRVLALAPAFGVAPALARDARRVVCARLQERLAEAAGERPELLAALCYGFGDLIDRDELDRRLLLWRPGQLAGGDLVTAQQWSLSRFPPRAGWTELQCALRGLAAIDTPPRMRDAAALLLCLSVSFAAPRAPELQGE